MRPYTPARGEPCFVKLRCGRLVQTYITYFSGHNREWCYLDGFEGLRRVDKLLCGNQLRDRSGSQTRYDEKRVLPHAPRWDAEERQKRAEEQAAKDKERAIGHRTMILHATMAAMMGGLSRPILISKKRKP